MKVGVAFRGVRKPATVISVPTYVNANHCADGIRCPEMLRSDMHGRAAVVRRRQPPGGA